MPDVGYLLGADFLSQFEVSKNWLHNTLRLGVLHEKVLPIVKQRYQPFQKVPMRRARGFLPLHLK